jgi:tetratricopeptide (TPR) repeat protein
MKKLSIIPILIISLNVYSQAVASKAPLADVNKTVYANAVKAGDINSAILAANYIVATNATSNYRDSLAILYLTANNLQPAFYWSSNVLVAKPTDAVMLEVKAVCLKNGNSPVAAIDAYTALLKVKPQATYAYELMQLQYGIKRLAECVNTGYATFKLPLDTNITVKYQVDEKTVLQTPLRSSILNLLAMAHNELGQLQDAKAALQEALKVDPKFVYALQNLKVVDAALLAKEISNKTGVVDEKATLNKKTN